MSKEPGIWSSEFAEDFTDGVKSKLSTLLLFTVNKNNITQLSEQNLLAKR